MKADLRISIKDCHKNKSLKVQLFRSPFAVRQFWVRMNGQPWPRSGQLVSLTRLLAALRKARVRRSGPRTKGIPAACALATAAGVGGPERSHVLSAAEAPFAGKHFPVTAAGDGRCRNPALCFRVFRVFRGPTASTA